MECVGCQQKDLLLIFVFLDILLEIGLKIKAIKNPKTKGVKNFKITNFKIRKEIIVKVL